MASWAELALDNHAAARELLGNGRTRSSISRAYYAAYTAVTGQLAAAGVQFPHDGNNPTHVQLPTLALNNLHMLPTHRRRQVAAALRRLRLAREAADYVPTASIDDSMALDSIRDAATVMELMEVKRGTSE